MQRQAFWVLTQLAIALAGCRSSHPTSSSSKDTTVLFVSDWSKPGSLRDDHLRDQALRGRLLVLQGMEPDYGGPPTTNGAMTFVELQNVTQANSGSIEVYFAVTNLHCELIDAAGKAVPTESPVAWGGRGPFSPYWVNLPYNSTIRLFINGGNLDPLALYPGGDPAVHWSIPKNDTNPYYLFGTLNLFTHTNYSGPPEFRENMYFHEYRTTLAFPKTKIIRK